MFIERWTPATAEADGSGARLHVLLACAPGEGAGWTKRLEAAGHEVVAAPDSEAILDLVEEGGIDLLLIDLDLPDAARTIRLCRFLTLDRASFPVIGLTRGPTAPGSDQDRAIDRLVGFAGAQDEMALLEALVAPASHRSAEVIDLSAWRAANGASLA